MSTSEALAKPAVKNAALSVAFLGVLAAIQGSAPNVASSALVSVSHGLHMASGTIALAASIQTVLIAATVISTGLAADRLGRRHVLQMGLLIGAAGAVICALAPVTAIYLLGQAVIGVGMGATYGSAFGYVHAVAKPGKLAAALGVFGASIGIATVLFTFLGSVLIGIDWRIGIATTAVWSVIAFFIVPILLPKQPRVGKGTSLDLLGQVLLGLGIIVFLYGVSQMGHSLTAPTTTVSLAVGALILAAFFVREAKSKSAFYPVHLFKSPIFIAAILAGFVYNYGNSVGFLQTTNLWQYVTGVSTKELALWQLPLVAAGVISALIIGRAMGKGLKNGVALLISTVITVIGFSLLAFAANAHSFWAFLPGTIVTGAGIVGASIPFGNLIIKEAPPAQYGPVTSSRTTIGQFWYSIGFALSTVLVDRLTVGGVTEKLDASGVQPDLMGQAVTSLDQYVSTGTDPSTELAQQALKAATESYGGAFSTVMFITAGLIAVAGVIGFILLRIAGAKAEVPPPPAAIEA